MIVYDMTRVAENAYMIQKNEEEYRDRSVSKIVLEICNQTDAATMSAKKDALVNNGGFLAVNDDDIFDKAQNMVVIYEGLHTYGGMAGRDMEATGRSAPLNRWITTIFGPVLDRYNTSVKS